MYPDAQTLRTMESDPADGEPNAEEIAPDAEGTKTICCPMGCTWFLEHEAGVVVRVRPYSYDYAGAAWLLAGDCEITNDEPVDGSHFGHRTVWWRIEVLSGTVSAEDPLLLKAAPAA